MRLSWPTECRNTTHTIDRVKEGVYSRTSFTPTTECIWLSLRTKTLSCNICAFLWKCLHQALRCGSYWFHIPNHKLRADCHTCNETESLSHILLTCEASGQNIIWPLAKELWLKKKLAWPELSLGSILGCAITDFRDASGHALPGANRLYTIIVSESLHLIWKIQCE